MDILQVVNKSQNRHLTPNTSLYRWQDPEHTLEEREGRFYITGNPHSNAEILDVYANDPAARQTSSRANSLRVLGIGVSDCSDREYAYHGSLNLEINLGDVLDAGGRIYPYAGAAASNDWYITIPEGKTIPAKANACASRLSQKRIMPETLARLGVAYNKISKPHRPLYINVNDWPHEPDGLFETLRREKSGDRFFVTGKIEYVIGEHQLTVSCSTTDESSPDAIAGAMLLRMMIKHPDIHKIVLPDNMKSVEFIKLHLKELGLLEYGFYSY